MSGSNQEESAGSKPDEEKIAQLPQTNTLDALHNPYFVDATKPSSASKSLPPWLDHFNAKDIKRLFKSSLAVWIMAVLMLIEPCLRAIGRATFLGCIILFIAPPAGIVFVQLMVVISVLLGCSLSWAWGVITMKAAVATWPQAEKQARFATLQQEAANTTDPLQYAEVQILNGYMLNTNVTITYFCMMGLFVYFMARLRVAFPKLILVQVVASIVTVVYLDAAPLLPTFVGTLAKVIVIPCSVAAGIGLVCNIFVFPTSSTSEALDGMRDVLALMPEFLDASVLGLKHPTLDLSEAKLTGLRTGVLSAYKLLGPLFRILPIDLSVGRWGSDDLSTLIEPFRQLTINFVALTELYRQTQVRKEKSIDALNRALASNDGSNSDQRTVELGQQQIDREFDFRVRSDYPLRNVLIKESIQSLVNPGDHLVDACKESLQAISEALAQAHALRKNPGQSEMQQRHAAVLSKLREQRDIFMASTSRSLAEISRKSCDDDGLSRGGIASSFAGLMLGILLQERLFRLADAIDQVLTRIVELEGMRTRLRVWFPSRLTALLRWIGHEDSSEDAVTAADLGDRLRRTSTVTSVSPNLQAKSETSDPYAKSARAELVRMRAPNGRKRSRGGRIVLAITNWFGNEESFFALRMVVVTLALSVPAVVKSTAGFFYRNRALWAVIMAQLTLVPYTAELLFGSLIRVFGTIIGGVIGMVAWYIGAGNGPGSPYGLAAIFAPAIILMMWCRLFTSPAMMPAGIMMGATAFLVAGYSWSDTQIPQYGTPGVGYAVFWRRVVTVLVGIAGALVVNFIPKPPSANRHCRHLLADTLVSVRDRYALFASSWKDPAPDLRQVAEEEGLAVGETLLAISGSIKLTVLEFSSSNFDTRTLVLVCNQCMILNQNITLLLQYTTRLSEGERARIIPATGAMNENLVTELMGVLSIVQQALKSGDPLPAVLPTPLFTKAVAHAREQVAEGISRSSDLPCSFPNKENVDSEVMRNFIVILNSLVQLLAALDELVLILKRAVGETSSIMMLETV
ncbi:hypothetical protein BGZ61DRAFT_371066 [Ilyonectria robusta]|uniref:uncharacterized protein n=1 Tax=Ilyonectria robusta TaxID=1079257 RepID=UPI001E8CE847|nr:uncharacterized protein BGZ61DRAFT_371066 [Ilyonectria robusta]KAH8658600.1 hypothetical protein BGZ61DRAFT_371066 [Ilyonectria robusta]